MVKKTTIDVSNDTWRWINSKKLFPGESMNGVLERIKDRQSKTVDEVVDELYTQYADMDGEVFDIPVEQRWIVEDIVKAVLEMERGEL